MRLLDTENGQFVPKDKWVRYAILSHTWDTEHGEQTYDELKKIQERYTSPSQASRNSLPAGHASHSRKRSQDGTFRDPLPSQLPDSSSSSSAAKLPLTAIGRLTQYEVEGLFRTFSEAYGLIYSIPASPSTSIWDDPELSPKIKNACRVARENGYRYIWIDSCCIDKSSSSELSEAINSMYKWYYYAEVCYAYLADVPPGEDHQDEGSAFRRSRWFLRGWTLQELISPSAVEFLSEDWAPIGSKHTLVALVESITKIDYKALLHCEPLNAFSVAQRLLWAAKRETTRVEDEAYSLLGIFDISMPTLYGEGDRAFRRLQEQIMQSIPDQSLFAWGNFDRHFHLLPSDLNLPETGQEYTLYWLSDYYGLMSHPIKRLFDSSPRGFGGCENIIAPHQATQRPSSHHREIVYTPTPHGIRTQFETIPLTGDVLMHILVQSTGGKKTTKRKFNVIKIQSSYPVDFDEDQWYLAILRGCEYSQYPGHLLGRVCYISPSKTGINHMYAGYIHCLSTDADTEQWDVPLLSLSPETLKLLRPQTELKTVYIPHPDGPCRLTLSDLREVLYPTLKLLMLRETLDALCFRGYSAVLRHPDQDHPTMHQLTLSHDEHTITITFQHTLADGGSRATIEAEVKASGPRVQLDSAADSNRAGCRTVSWHDGIRWKDQLDHKRVRLNADGAKTLTVDLRLDLAGHGHYFLRVDVLIEELPASSATAPEGEERGDEADSSPSKTGGIEEVGWEEEGGDEMESVVM